MNLNPLTVSGADTGIMLLQFLARRLNISGKQAKRLLDSRSVFVNRRRVWMARHVLEARDQVEIVSEAPAQPAGDIPILFRDEDYVIVNKPAGLSSEGPGGMEQVLRDQLRRPTLQLVHRLDKDTTGCLWCALNPSAREAAVQLFESRAPLKVYHALVRGQMAREDFTISRPLDGQPAVTHVMVLDTRPTASHIKVKLETGRTHQVRKHLAGLRHPLLGDSSYAPSGESSPALRQVPRQMLHASVLAFSHPKTGAPVRAQAPLPADFKRVMKSLKLT